MPRVQEGYDPRAEALQTTAAPIVKTEMVRFDPNASSAFQLAAALGKAQPVIDKFKEDYDRQKLQDQILKIDAYKAQFQKDGTTGPVTAAQVGERFPETVPVIRARIAEGIGAEQGKKLIQPIIDEVMNNNELMTNSEARAAFIQKKRQELIGSIQPGNEFYSSGLIASIDKELGQYENSWQRQTAVYHKEVQAKDFSSQVVSALAQNDPQKALEDLDAKWKVSSSLNNLDRNKLVIDTTTKQAFAADDPALLDKIPTRFLNAETRAEIQRTKILIQEKRMQTVRDAEFLKNQARQEATRNDEIEMINAAAEGKDIDPYKYKNNPDSFQKALTIKDADKMPQATSAANSQRVRTSIINGATTAGLDQNAVIDSIRANPNLNNADKKKLIEEVPKLVEGVIAMQDDMVKSAYNVRIGASLDALEKSTNSRISSIVTGTNLRSQAVAMFDNGIRRGFTAFYEENGRWPTGKAKQDIVDREIEKADKYIESKVRLGGEQPAPAAPSGTQPGRGAAPAASSGPVKVTNDAEYNALKPGTLFVGPDGVQRRKP